MTVIGLLAVAEFWLSRFGHAWVHESDLEDDDHARICALSDDSLDFGRLTHLGMSNGAVALGLSFQACWCRDRQNDCNNNEPLIRLCPVGQGPLRLLDEFVSAAGFTCALAQRLPKGMTSDHWAVVPPGVAEKIDLAIDFDLSPVVLEFIGAALFEALRRERGTA